MPEIVYFNPQGEYRQLSQGMTEAEKLSGLQRGLGADQQQRQFDRRMAQQQRQFDQEMELAGLRKAQAEAGMAEEAQNNAKLRDYYIDLEKQKSQLPPAQRRQFEFEQVAQHISDPKILERARDAYLENETAIQVQEEIQAATQAIADAQEDGLLGEGEEGSQAFQARLDAGEDPKKVAKDLQELRMSQTAIAVNEDDWGKFLPAMQQTIENLPESPVKNQLRLAVKHWELYPSTRKKMTPQQAFASVQADAAESLEDFPQLGGGKPGQSMEELAAQQRSPEYAAQREKKSKEREDRGMTGMTRKDWDKGGKIYNEAKELLSTPSSDVQETMDALAQQFGLETGEQGGRLLKMLREMMLDMEQEKEEQGEKEEAYFQKLARTRYQGGGGI